MSFKNAVLQIYFIYLPRCKIRVATYALLLNAWQTVSSLMPLALVHCLILFTSAVKLHRILLFKFTEYCYLNI